MQSKFFTGATVKKSLIFTLFIVLFSCKKDYAPADQLQLPNEESSASKANSSGESQYNLEVVLRGEGNRNGHIHFRQDRDAAKIITLDTKIRHLEPNHEYLLQRAVDPINVVDGNCTSTSWLTLGHGLTPRSIMTDDKGNGEEELWRDVSAIPSGSIFDIHFRVIDKVSGAVVLTSDCYQYTVR